MNKLHLPRISIYFFLLLAGLLIIYYPSFKNAPRSDYWVVFYHFHLADSSPEPMGWLSLCNYDPWEHGTFRPLAHLLLYLEYTFFGTNFIWNHLINFFMYYLSILLLYLLAVRLSLDRYLTAIFLLLYAFLFSHFDIITWTFQIFTTMSFVCFLIGFLIYIKFLASGKRMLLFLIGILFLFGMLCFELYAFWPLAVIILTLGRHFFLHADRGPSTKKLLRTGSLFLVILYLVYIAIFLITRVAASTSGDLPELNLELIVLGICSVFFNLLYNGILVNLLPFVTEPLVIRDNLDMAGLLVGWYKSLSEIIFLTGGGAILLLGTGGVLLYRRKKRKTIFILSFFGFLLFTYFFIVAISRLTTNDIWYPFTQFRYQYIANALLILMVITIVSRLVRPGRLGKIIISFILLLVLSINLLLSHKYMAVINSQLEPLTIMLSNIESRIKNGEINSQAKLLIEDTVTVNLPPLCWNEDMARFMPDNYRWFFSKKEQNFFSSSLPEAAWIIRGDDYLTIKRK
jgi:hypothetical protein